MSDDLDPQLVLDFATIDLRIEEWLRGVDEDVIVDNDLDDEDRSLIIYYMRLAYMQGHRDGRKGIVPLEGV